MSGAILIGDVVGKIRMLEIVCTRCPRRGRMSIARLLAEHGPDYPIYRVWENVNADCPHRDSASIYERCRVHGANLVGVT
jgi:hypothetical protein